MVWVSQKDTEEAVGHYTSVNLVRAARLIWQMPSLALFLCPLLKPTPPPLPPHPLINGCLPEAQVDETRPPPQLPRDVQCRWGGRG